MGVVLPGLLVAVGLHDLITGETLFIFSSSEFRQNVARYALVESAARISGAAMIGLGIGIGLRNLAGLIGRKQLPSDSLAVPTIIISLLLFLVAHWFLPGYESLSGF